MLEPCARKSRCNIEFIVFALTTRPVLPATAAVVIAGDYTNVLLTVYGFESSNTWF